MIKYISIIPLLFIIITCQNEEFENNNSYPHIYKWEKTIENDLRVFNKSGEILNDSIKSNFVKQNYLKTLIINSIYAKYSIPFDILITIKVIKEDSCIFMHPKWKSVPCFMFAFESGFLIIEPEDKIAKSDDGIINKLLKNDSYFGPVVNKGNTPLFFTSYEDKIKIPLLSVYIDYYNTNQPIYFIAFQDELIDDDKIQEFLSSNYIKEMVIKEWNLVLQKQ